MRIPLKLMKGLDDAITVYSSIILCRIHVIEDLCTSYVEAKLEKCLVKDEQNKMVAYSKIFIFSHFS